jgi:hypothetical protein
MAPHRTLSTPVVPPCGSDTPSEWETNNEHYSLDLVVYCYVFIYNASRISTRAPNDSRENIRSSVCHKDSRRQLALGQIYQ